MRDMPGAREGATGARAAVATELVHQFNQLQAERVHTYRLLEEGHKSYLASGPDHDFQTFRQRVHEVTQDFKRISEGVLGLIEGLHHAGQPSLAAILESVQSCEKRKLELTAHLQLARQMVEEGGSGEMERNKVREIRGELGKIVEEINDLLTELRYEMSGEGEAV